MYGVIILICMLLALEIWRKRQVKKNANNLPRKYIVTIAKDD